MAADVCKWSTEDGRGVGVEAKAKAKAGADA